MADIEKCIPIKLGPWFDAPVPIRVSFAKGYGDGVVTIYCHEIFLFLFIYFNFHFKTC